MKRLFIQQIFIGRLISASGKEELGGGSFRNMKCTVWEAAWHWADFYPCGGRGHSSCRNKAEVPGERELYQMVPPPTTPIALLVTDGRMLCNKEFGWSLSCF